MKEAHRALRDATAAAHDAIDALFGGFDLSDRTSYAAFLRAHADALLPLEAGLDAAGAERVIEDWAERRRGPLLREDLAFLRAPGEAPLGPPQPAPLTADEASIAGTLYVVEGSRLGGKFLARQIPPNFPRAYLDADQPFANWRKLLDRIETILYAPAQIETAVGAALKAFAAFERAGKARLPG